MHPVANASRPGLTIAPAARSPGSAPRGEDDAAVAAAAAAAAAADTPTPSPPGRLALSMAAAARDSTAELFSISAMISSCVVKLRVTTATGISVHNTSVQ
jgi:hypothetical protein|eukprot:COSAG06_NODE_325_length_17475_cov_13.436982_16_plen_100_part_00